MCGRLYQVDYTDVSTELSFGKGALPRRRVKGLPQAERSEPLTRRRGTNPGQSHPAAPGGLRAPLEPDRSQGGAITQLDVHQAVRPRRSTDRCHCRNGLSTLTRDQLVRGTDANRPQAGNKRVPKGHRYSYSGKRLAEGETSIPTLTRPKNAYGSNASAHFRLTTQP